MRGQDMMSLDQIAKHLGMPAHKVEALFKSGELPGSVEDGQWMASRNTVESWRMNSGLGSVMRAWGGSPTPKKPDPPASVPQSWQQPSASKSSSGFGGASPRELAAQARSAKLPPPPPPPKATAPQPLLVNEPVMTPASLELDLSILERLEIPDPDGEGSEDPE